MNLFFGCPFCRAHLRGHDDDEGKTTTCPTCKTDFPVPPAAGGVACGCGEFIAYSGEVAGDEFHCPSCKALLKLSADTAAKPKRKVVLKKLGETPESEAAVPSGEVNTPAPASPTKSGWGLFGRQNRAWCLVDCLTGQKHVVDKLPCEVGSGSAVDWRLPQAADQHFALLEQKGGTVSLVSRSVLVSTEVNGQPLTGAEPLKWDTDYSLRVGAHLILLRGGRKIDEWASGLDMSQWMLFEPRSQQVYGPISRPDVLESASQLQADPQTTVVFPQGATMGFYLQAFAAATGQQMPSPSNAPVSASVQSPSFATAERGEITCPVCWLRFDKGDVMHIAAHESLRGDPILGTDAALRFTATRFNNHGHALDAMGVPCPDVACPHCRRKLPPGFLDVPHRIFSLVGETTAGKTYYLSSAAKMLPEVLYRQFGVTFKDADPTGNRHLNAMKNRLFSGATPEQVRLEKTQAQGDLYERVILHGQETRLPAPFMFSLNPPNHEAGRQGLVFYDLAGELFQPGVSEYDAPKTQHIAVASSLFFLFDPTLSRGFRRVLQNHPDPQLQSPQTDQQDTLLAEMEVRIKRLLGLDGRARIQTPLAILVGKCDVWQSLLGEPPLKSVASNGALDIAALSDNSDRVRSLLLELSPNIVANAESLSHKVCYFAVSAFGHSPVRLPDGNLAPDPNLLRPLHVEQPFLWAIAEALPGLLPVNGTARSQAQG